MNSENKRLIIEKVRQDFILAGYCVEGEPDGVSYLVTNVDGGGFVANFGLTSWVLAEGYEKEFPDFYPYGR